MSNDTIETENGSAPLKAIVVLSGGLDSAVCLAIAAEEAEVMKAITFNYGQKAFDNELAASSALAKHYGVPHQVIDLDWLKTCLPQALDASDTEQQAWDEPMDRVDHVWVPNRNGVFINIAASFAEALGCDLVVFGANAEEGETFSDNTPEFRQAISDSLMYSTQNHVQVATPVANLNKRQILEAGLELKVPLHLIWSCYEAGDSHCGQCPSCQRVKAAIAQLNPADQQQLKALGL